MKIKVESSTEIGNYRKVNQDCLKYAKNSDRNYLFLVCDGMGGHAHGEVASKFAADFIVNSFEKMKFNDWPSSKIKAWIKEIIHETKMEMIKFSQKKDDDFFDMGTTIAGLIIINDHFFVFNVGDSRVYYDNGYFKQLTIDQNVWNAQNNLNNFENKQLDNTMGDYADLTFWKSLTSALGPNKKLDVNIHELQTNVGTYILTTDGVHDYIDDESFHDFLVSKDKLNKKAKKIIEHALKNYSTDNLSIMIIEVGE